MSKCKLVVRRLTQGLDLRGDVVNVYPFEVYLGDMVEPQGGAFIIVEVVDADFMHPDIQQFIEPNLNPVKNNKIIGIKPAEIGQNYYEELITTGRVSVTLETLLKYKIEY